MYRSQYDLSRHELMLIVDTIKKYFSPTFGIMNVYSVDV